MAYGYLDELLAKRQKADDSKRPDERYTWWEALPENEDDEEFAQKQRAGSLLSCAQGLETVQREIHEQNLWSAQLYSNRELAAFDWGGGQMVRASLSPISRVGENITVRVV